MLLRRENNMRGSCQRLLLPGERESVRVSAVAVWGFVVFVSIVWLILFVAFDAPEVQAQPSVNNSSMVEVRDMRRREVKALERIASSLEKIAREMK